MVTATNNNKWYEMIYDGGGSFTVNFGRVEGGSQTASYPINKWDNKYREKVAKGYKDVTELVSIEENDSSNKEGSNIKGIKDTKVVQFLTLMSSYTNNLVSNTYTVKAENVTQAQVDEAQAVIDKLKKLSNKLSSLQTTANDCLIELYTIIPRKMRSVRDFLLPTITLNRTIEQEQDNLDAIASQVAMINQRKPKKGVKKDFNLLEELGISRMETDCARDYDGDIGYLIKQITGRSRVEAVFSLNKPSENKIYDDWIKKQKNKASRILIHGTRNSSVLPILKTNLQIRPSGNFQFSGKVYGDGNYFSETVNKSLNYTGNDADKVLLVYEVHIGNPFVYDGWYRGNSFTLNYKNLQDKGFDSTFVKAGGGLLNSEIIAYREEQNRIKYIIWVKQ